MVPPHAKRILFLGLLAVATGSAAFACRGKPKKVDHRSGAIVSTVVSNGEPVRLDLPGVSFDVPENVTKNPPIELTAELEDLTVAAVSTDRTTGGPIVQAVRLGTKDQSGQVTKGEVFVRIVIELPFAADASVAVVVYEGDGNGAGVVIHPEILDGSPPRIAFLTNILTGRFVVVTGVVRATPVVIDGALIGERTRFQTRTPVVLYAGATFALPSEIVSIANDTTKSYLLRDQPLGADTSLRFSLLNPGLRSGWTYGENVLRLLRATPVAIESSPRRIVVRDFVTFAFPAVSLEGGVQRSGGFEMQQMPWKVPLVRGAMGTLDFGFIGRVSQ